MIVHPILHKEDIKIDIPDPDQQIQPNAIDITIDKVYQLNHITDLIITKNGKGNVKRKYVEIMATDITFHCLGCETAMEGWVFDHPGTYVFESESKIELSAGYAGWLIQRSTLNRNGVIVTSGLYDSGYNGPIGGAIQVIDGGRVVLEKGSRVAQLITVSAESVGLYDGQYQEKSVADAKQRTFKWLEEVAA